MAGLTTLPAWTALLAHRDALRGSSLRALFAEDRHISKSFCHGQYALAGVSAALMAEIGRAHV